MADCGCRSTSGTAAVTRTLVTAGVAVTEARRDERQLEDVFEMTEHEAEASHVRRGPGDPGELASWYAARRPGCCSRAHWS